MGEEIKNISSYRSRKFILTVSILLIGTLFTWLGDMDYSQWVYLVQVILGLYGAANVVEYGAGKYNETKKEIKTRIRNGSKTE